MAKIVQLKTPLELRTYLWLNGALVSLADLADLLVSQKERKIEQSMQTGLVRLQSKRAFAATGC